MATIINNPADRGSDEGMGVGLIVGILVMLIVGVLLFMFGRPLFWNTYTKTPPTTQNIDIHVPTPTQKTAETVTY